MSDDEKITLIAKTLFPDDFHEGDCHAEPGHEGRPMRSDIESWPRAAVAALAWLFFLGAAWAALQALFG